MADFDWASLIGSGLSFIGGLTGNVINSRVAQENINAIKNMNTQNIAFQQRENEIARAREDNAVQRRALDLQAAGLSKTLSAGSPASAQPMTAPSTQALHNQFKYESALQKLNIAQIMQDMSIKNRDLDIKRDVADSEIAKNMASAGNLDAQSSSLYGEEGYYSSATALNRISTNLKNIEGTYLAEQIEAKISNLKAETNYFIAKEGLTLEESYTEYMRQLQISLENSNLSVQGKILAEQYAQAEFYTSIKEHESNIIEKEDQTWWFNFVTNTISKFIPGASVVFRKQI